MPVKTLVQNIDNIAVYDNELLTPHAINRNIKKLLENDEALYDFYKEQLAGIVITDYVKSNEYDVGMLVWYLHTRTKKLYLLKSIVDKNTTEPDPDKFEQTGWKDESKYLDILRYGICCDLAQLVDDKFDEHESDAASHKFGKVSLDPDSDDYIGKKVLKQDLSNLDSARSINFFPTYARRMQTAPVLNGMYRKWDCNIVEYDFTFTFATSEDVQTQCACEKIGYTSCDCPDDSTVATNYDISANFKTFDEDDGDEVADYFMDVETDGNIFNISDTINSYDSSVGRIKFYKRTDYVNTYSATIYFPVKFTNTHYMVYTNNVLCQVEGGSTGVKTSVPSSNDLVICGKTRTKMTILNISYPSQGNFGSEGINALHGGMSASSFHCRVVGECVS